MAIKAPSKYQKEIFKAYNTTNSNIFISATAGSGKTTTMLELVNQTPPYKKVWMSAFNKSIADELKSRVRLGVEVSTLHSKGMSLLRANLSCKFTVKELKSWIFGKRLFYDFLDKKYKNNEKDKSIYLFTLSRLVDLYRMNLVDPTFDNLTLLSERYGVDADPLEIEQTLKLIGALDEYNSNPLDELTIDFTDMLWLTYKFVKKQDYPKYHVVFIDECLPYHMPVLLADGTSLPIGKIVEEKLEVDVLTYNIEKKIQEPKKVNGFGRSVNSKRMLKIKGHNSRNHNIGSFVVCTFNHKIYVKDVGFIYAEAIKEGMVIQYETLANKTEKYKITTEGRKTLSKTMTIKNNNPLIIKKICGTREKFNKIKGGNGRINVLQTQFLHDINDISSYRWESELAIKTDNEARLTGSPNHYKIDIACLERKIAIEIDGQSHKNLIIKEKDNRKDLFLKRNGWIVKRINNSDLIKNYDNVLDHIKTMNLDFCYDGINCIVDLVVDNISDISTKEKWVYDISVEDNHNFYANGILVHNCQDLNPLQKRLIDNSIASNGRFVAVGDENQTIYSFQGSNLDSLNAFKNTPNTISLPLSVSYRCAKNIVKEASKIFTGIEYAENAVDGVVRTGELDEIRSGDFVLCRNNLPIVERYIDMLSWNRKSYILGRDFGRSLMDLTIKIDKVEDLDIILQEKKKVLEDKGVINVDSNPTYQSLKEKCQIIRILFNRWKSLEKVKINLESMFKEDSEIDRKNAITFSTIHKSKGLEAERVFIINRELLPSKYAKTELELHQEKCLEYVAITRAKRELVYVKTNESLDEIPM